ncbi:MAG: TonB C-terminal domain-containing protein [Burkholderiales bacterium]
MPAIVLAVLVHLAIFAILIFGVSWQTKEAPPVEVELWNKLPEGKVAEAAPVPEAKAEPKVEEPPPPPPKEEPKPPPPVKEPESEPEPEPPKPDLALKEKQEKERKAKDQAEKAAKEKQEKEAKEKGRKEQETLAQKQKQEQLAQEKAQKEEQDKLAAAQQAAADKAAAERAALQSAMNSYIDKIRQKVKNNTDVPDGVFVGTRQEVKLVVLPTGEVLSAEPVGGSSKVYSDAIQRGIKRAEPLPLPEDPKLRQQFRSFNMTFTHEK